MGIKVLQPSSPFVAPRNVIVTHLTKGNDARCGPVNLSTCANNATGTMQKLTVDQGVLGGNQKKVVQKGNNLGDLPTPINPQNLKNELKDYDRETTQYLVRGIEEGFRLGCLHSPSIHPPHNHKSALEHKEVVHEYIIKGQACDRIAGPFESPPLNNFKVSLLGVVPKSEQGKFRIIHDLSFPENNSVNSNIPVEYSVVKYDSIDDVISLILKFGKGALMAKSDIKDAFRIMPVNPDDYHLLGFTWENQYYYERCLPMGASSSCNILRS